MQKTKCVLIHKCQSIQKCNLIMYVQSNIQGIQMQQQLVNKSSYINNWSLRILNDKKILFIYSFTFLLKKICYLNRHILIWTGIMFYYNLTFKHFINCTQFPIQVSNAMRGIGNSNIVQFRLYRKYIWINRNLKCNKFDEQNDKQKGNDARNTMMHVFVSRSVESELQQRQ